MYLTGSQIEIINPEVARGHVRHALFDLDGTISLIREGWQGVMIPLMVKILRETPKGREESEEKLYWTVSDFVTRLTGRETIYQMLQLCEEISKRGGHPLAAVEYKHQYQAFLWERIKGRISALETGRILPDEMMVPSASPMLEALHRRGIRCYLASGTDEHYVVGEARLLQVLQYFERVYGALDDWKSYSKRQVIDRIIEENKLHAEEFVSFGDGFVEIEETKAVGGIAVGIASNEVTRQGRNEWKRKRLIEAGADIIAPDFRDHGCLVAFLCGK